MNRPSTSSQVHRPLNAQLENLRLVSVVYRIMPPVIAANAISATPRVRVGLAQERDAIADAEGGDGAFDRTSEIVRMP